MKINLPLSVLLLTAATPAVAETRNFSVTGFERIRVEGPFAVTMTTNVAPFARATGSLRAIDGVSLRVEGTTLIVQANRSAWGGSSRPPGPVTIAVGAHDLRHASVSGTGSLAIDRVRGLEFILTVSGSGEGGIGSAEVDRLKLNLVGSGSARVAGKSDEVTAVVQGASALDASALGTKSLKLTAMGPASVKASVSGTADIRASGTAAVVITGNPTCTVKASGSATVVGCD